MYSCTRPLVSRAISENGFFFRNILALLPDWNGVGGALEEEIYFCVLNIAISVSMRKRSNYIPKNRWLMGSDTDHPPSNIHLVCIFS